MYQQSAPESIQAMFASIAQNYDRANAIFSLGLYKRWNKKLVDAAGSSTRLLDLCAGTGEISFAFLQKNPQSEAILLDFCPEMLEIAQKKGEPFSSRFEIIKADAQAIPLEKESVDFVSIAYGIRNVKKPEKCFQEVYRVLTPEGRFGILELTRPTTPLLRMGHRLYTHFLLPLIGKFTAKNFEAYKYLATSIATFTSPEELEKTLHASGFKIHKRRPLLGGIATLFVADKS